MPIPTEVPESITFSWYSSLVRCLPEAVANKAIVFYKPRPQGVPKAVEMAILQHPPAQAWQPNRIYKS